MPRKVRIEVGLRGRLRKVGVVLPDGEPLPWGPSDQLRVVGKPVVRLDAVAKVTGRARYTTDLRRPGMLHAAVLRSPHASAAVTRVDLSGAERVPGVKAAVALKVGEVRHAGQAVAAVAAVSPEIARAALAEIRVTWGPRAHVTDLEAARRGSAPPVYPPGARRGLQGNVRRTFRKATGDVAKGMRQARFRAAGRYRCRVQTHSCLEPHGAVAEWRDGTLHCWTSTQATFAVRSELARAFGLPEDRVRVYCEFMGGGFGSKLWGGDWTTLAARLAKKAGAPVRLVLDRRAEHEVAGNRPDALMEVEAGVRADGTLTALTFRSFGSAGVGDNAATSRPAMHLYPCPNRLLEDHDVYTNRGPGRPFRAPGHPQGCFAIEQLVDQLAEAAGIDPLALRLKNDPHPVRRAELLEGARRFGWSTRRGKPGAGPGPVKRGLGLASGLWYSTGRPPAGARVTIDAGGRVALFCGGQDIGTGTRTILAQVVAEELGLEASEIATHIGDTIWPDAPSSGGSKTAPCLTPTFRAAAWKLRERLFGEARRQRRLPARAPMVALAGKVFPRGRPAEGLALAVLAAGLAPSDRVAEARRARNWAEQDGVLGGVQFAEVTVDTETGVVRVERILALQDCGRVVNPVTARSQLYGGVIQGVSYALYEEQVMDPTTGRMLNTDLEHYRIAGAKDVPVIEAVFMDVSQGQNNTGVAGVGEPVTVPTAAAIANAVYNAIGARVTELPMTPARVLAALKASAGGPGARPAPPAGRR